MGSINAESVAKEVGQKMLDGELVDLQAITRKHGYSEKSAKTQKAKNTKTYQKTITRFVPLLNEEIAKIQLVMASRDISREKYKDLADVLDKLYKNKQLAVGGKTDNTSITVTFDSAFKERII